MPLVAVSAGQQAQSAQLNQLINLLTGVMTDQPVTLGNALTVTGTGSVAAPTAGAAGPSQLALVDIGNAVGNGGALLVGGTTGKFFGAIKGYLQDGNTNTRGDLVFWLRNAVADASLTERARITSGGDLRLSTSKAWLRGDDPVSTGHALIRASSFGYGGGVGYPVIQVGDGYSIALGVDVSTITGSNFTGTGEVIVPNVWTLRQLNGAGDFAASMYFNGATTWLRGLSTSSDIRIAPGGNDAVWAHTYAYVGIQAGSSTAPSHTLHLFTDDAAKTATSTWTITSDRRLKKEVRPFAAGLDAVLSLRPSEWEWDMEHPHRPHDARAGERHVGFVAQDHIHSHPYLIRNHRHVVNAAELDAAGNVVKAEESEHYYGMNLHALWAVYANAIRELHERIEALETTT